MKSRGSHLLPAAAAAALSLTGGQAQSQVAPTLTGEWAIEQQMRDRWIHERQLPRFTPFKFNRAWLIVDSLRAGETGRRLYLTLGRTVGGRDSAFISTDVAGRIVRLHVGLSPPVLPSVSRPGDSARSEQWRRFRAFDGGLALAESRVWDLVPTFPSATPRAGVSWTDTIAQIAGDGPYFRQTVRGSRTSRIVRDTVVDERRLWVVRDSAQVQYEEHYLERERTLDTTTQLLRTAAGEVRGVHLYDPEIGLFRKRDDTTSLAGEAVLRYADGRSFRTPARYERTRRWDLYDAQQYFARKQQLRDEGRGEFGGMVVVPANDLQRRLADGDAQARDSVLTAWQRTADPNEAAWLLALLTRWSRDAAYRARLDTLRVAAGDTAHLYEVLASRSFSGQRPFNTAQVRGMLRFMEDPETLWALNLERDHLYENLAHALTTWPRAAMVPGSVSYAACTAEACELLAVQWQTASEPRTRDVGLVALFSLDPARWADTVLALAGPRRPLLHRAATLAKGIGATWDAASKAVIPSPNSDWRAWLEWMDGRDPAYVAALRGASASLSDRIRSDTIARVRFEESHRTAIRMYTARTGRDVAGELERAYASAKSDSARLVFGTMLQRLGQLRLNEDEIADSFTSREPARVALARDALLSAFRRSGTALDPATAAPFLDRLLAATVDAAPFWRFANGAEQSRGSGRPRLHARPQRIFVNGEGLPESVRAKWSGRIEIISLVEWREHDPREAGVLYTLTPLRGWGRFVQVELAVSERLARPPGQAPAHYASANTYYLMELNGEWVVVASDGWIT